MMPDYFAYLCIVVKIATIDELDEVVDLKMSIAYHIFGSYKARFHLSIAILKCSSTGTLVRVDFNFRFEGVSLKFSLRGGENSLKSIVFTPLNAVAIIKCLSVSEAAFKESGVYSRAAFISN